LREFLSRVDADLVRIFAKLVEVDLVLFAKSLYFLIIHSLFAYFGQHFLVFLKEVLFDSLGNFYSQILMPEHVYFSIECVCDRVKNYF